MDHEARIKESIRKLEQHLLNHEGMDSDEILNHAMDYASENPGDYFLTLPGIILPIFT